MSSKRPSECRKARSTAGHGRVNSSARLSHDERKSHTRYAVRRQQHTRVRKYIQQFWILDDDEPRCRIVFDLLVVAPTSTSLLMYTCYCIVLCISSCRLFLPYVVIELYCIAQPLSIAHDVSLSLYWCMCMYLSSSFLSLPLSLSLGRWFYRS